MVTRGEDETEAESDEVGWEVRAFWTGAGTATRYWSAMTNEDRMTGVPPCGRSKPRAAVTLILSTPERGTGASGCGLPGVGVVDREMSEPEGVGVCDERDDRR